MQNLLQSTDLEYNVKQAEGPWRLDLVQVQVFACPVTCHDASSTLMKSLHMHIVCLLANGPIRPLASKLRHNIESREDVDSTWLTC